MGIPSGPDTSIDWGALVEPSQQIAAYSHPNGNDAHSASFSFAQPLDLAETSSSGTSQHSFAESFSAALAHFANMPPVAIDQASPRSVRSEGSGLAYKRVEEDLDFFETGLKSSPRMLAAGIDGHLEGEGVLQAIARAAASGYRWLSDESQPAVYDDRDDASVGYASPANHAARFAPLLNEMHMSLVREPDNRAVRGDLIWFPALLNLFGGGASSQQDSLRTIASLVGNFFRTNVIYVGQVVHTPSLMHMLFDPTARKKLHPALLPAILAAAVIDAKRSRLEPYTVDASMLDGETSKLVSVLYNFASRELRATVESGSFRDISMAQAATILALVSGPADREALLTMLEQTIIANKWDQRILDEPQMQGSSNAPYYSRPWSGPPGLSIEGRIEHESLVRIAWTASGHWARSITQYPDREPAIHLPEVCQHVLPIGFWDSSSLPDELPEAFFRSQEVFRIGAAYIRLGAFIEKMPSDGTATLDEGRWYSNHLDDIEQRLSRIRLKELPSDERPLRDELIRVVSRVMTPMRLSIWRKTGYWTERAFEDYIIDFGDHAGGDDSGIPTLKKSYIPPSVATWLEVVGDLADDLERESTGDSEKGNLELSSTLAYVNALLQLHQALKEGGTALSLANRLMRGLPPQVQIRERKQMPIPGDFSLAMELTRQDLERMVISDPIISLIQDPIINNAS